MAPSDVTIIVTNHDYAPFLDASITSALAQGQTCTIQVVVVDDGSTDGSDEVLRRWEHRAEIIRQANGGQASAFNRGFERAAAPVVMFLDADDVLLPGAARAVAEALRANPAAVRVQFPLICIDAMGRPIGTTIPSDAQALVSGDLRRRVLTFPDDVAWQPTTGNAFAAPALRRILPMPEAPYRISADHYLSNLTALHGEVVALGAPYGQYRVHGSNADHRDRLDVERLRQIIGRTITTHEAMAVQASSLGLEFPADPTEVASVTFAASRLVSLRIDPGRHPVPGDRPWRLVRLGVRAAAGRFDLAWGRRLAMAAWFLVVARAPRPVVRWLAAAALTR